MIELTLASVEQTRSLARVLARVLQPPALVTIAGELGTGKTTLVREILRARGVQGTVTSPSFTLAQSYHGSAGEDLHHLDLYRLHPGADIDLFAWDDYFGPQALTFIEWPAAGSEALPVPEMQLELEHHSVDSRVMRLQADDVLEEAVAEGAAAAGIALTEPERGR